MKKIPWILGAVILVLSSCGSPTSSSSLSPSSSSSSSSTGTSSSSGVDVPSFVDYIASRSSKYNNGKTIESIMSEAGLSGSSASTEGNLLKALKAAFDGYMPELTGQRKYGGVYALPTITGSISDEAKEALTWLVSYGLWGDEAFIESKEIDEAFLETMMQRPLVQ